MGWAEIVQDLLAARAGWDTRVEHAGNTTPCDGEPRGSSADRREARHLREWTGETQLPLRSAVERG